MSGETDNLSGTSAAPAGARRALMPPHLLLHDFLDETAVLGLLAHAEARQADFEPTGVGKRPDTVVNLDVRRSAGLRDLGAFRQLLTDLIYTRADELLATLRMSPAQTSGFETELVAHGDGAFYRQHIDTQTATDKKHFRLLSGVYYFCREPKAFSGGALRLYAFGEDRDTFVDIEPTRNTLLLFPSWALHEVMPVSVPSGAFMDSRFAINCWVYKARTKQPDQSEPMKA